MLIKGFVFDLDGVITETASLHYEAWARVIKKIGINFTKEENATLKGLPRLETLKGILKIHNMVGKFSEKELIEMSIIKNNDYKKMLDTSLTKENILPGIERFLNDAKQMNIKMSMASSSFNAPKILKKLGLFDFFDFIVDPSSLKNGKPSPEIFLKGCEGINLKPDEVIGFEDAIPGVEGLVAAKIKTVAITHGDEGKWEMADMILFNTNELEIEKVLRLAN